MIIGKPCPLKKYAPQTHDFKDFPQVNESRIEVVKISKGQEKFFTIFVSILWEFWVIVLDIHSDKASDSALFFQDCVFACSS